MKIHKYCVTEVITRKRHLKGRHFAYENELKNIVKNVFIPFGFEIFYSTKFFLMKSVAKCLDYHANSLMSFRTVV